MQQAYGVHVNGYVEVDGEKHLWVAKRSATKQTFPGMLDHLVAGGQVSSCSPLSLLIYLLLKAMETNVFDGGQSEGIGCKANVIKECDEEAGIPADLAAK